MEHESQKKQHISNLMPHVSKVIQYFSQAPLTVTKTLHTHLALPVIGFLYLLRMKRIEKEAAPLVLIALYGVVFSIVKTDTQSLVRSIQFLGISLFFSYIITFRVRPNLNQFLLLSFIFLGYDLISTDSILYSKSFLGIHFPRLKGIVGEYNYSGLLYVGLFLLSFINKNKLYMLLFTVLTILTGSRASMSALALFPFIYISKEFLKFKKLTKVIVVLLCLSPFFPYALRSSISHPLFYSLNQYSSQRLDLQASYIDTVIKNPLGIGYYNNDTAIKRYVHKKLSIRQPHSFYLDILVRFGFPGLIIFSFFLIRVVSASSHGLLVIPFLYNLLFLNALHEYITYIIMALCVINKLPKEHDPSID